MQNPEKAKLPLTCNSLSSTVLIGTMAFCQKKLLRGKALEIGIYELNHEENFRRYGVPFGVIQTPFTYPLKILLIPFLIGISDMSRKQIHFNQFPSKGHCSALVASSIMSLLAVTYWRKEI